MNQKNGSPVKPCVWIWINPINLLNQLGYVFIKQRQFGIKENALLRQTAEGAWGKAPKNFFKKKNIKKQVKI